MKMKKQLIILLLTLMIVGCKTTQKTVSEDIQTKTNENTQTNAQIQTNQTDEQNSQYQSTLITYDTTLPVDTITGLPPVKSLWIQTKKTTRNTNLTNKINYQTTKQVTITQRIRIKEKTTKTPYVPRYIYAIGLGMISMSALALYVIIKRKISTI